MAKVHWDWSLFRLAVVEAGIRGELTAEWRATNPDVEPAHALLERIAEEKAELVRTKQIRKEKPLPPINPEEVPFDIPESWEWVRLGDVAKHSSNLNIQKLLDPETVVNYVDIDSLDAKTGAIAPKQEPVKNLSSRARRVLSEAELVYSLVRPYLRNIALVPAGVDWIGSTGFAAIQSSPISPQFLFFTCISEVIQEQHAALMDGFNSPSISMGEFNSTLTPIPPVKEQQEIVRILSALDSGEFDGPVHPVVARIQKLEKEFRALAGEYESQEKWLSDLRSALLQEAISGELTADWRATNPDIEPAHALIERIAEEKAELIRTKQIPKGKPLPPINPEEMPFDIPDTWECMRMNDACELWNGRAYKKHELLEKGPTKVLRVGNFFTNDKYFYSDLDLEPQKYCETGDLLYAWSASFGPRIWEGGKVIYHYHIWKVQCFESEMKKYLYWFFEYDVERVKSQQGRGDFMLHVTKAAMSARMLPLPPAEEQKEIVRRLEMQLEKLDALQLELEQSKEAGQLLMKSKLAEVFEKKTPLVKSVLNG